MAKQIGELKITGTIDDITYYKMEEAYYARRKSSLDGKRVKKDPRFKRTMEWAHRLARGSQLASQVYRSLPRQEQVYTLYKELKSLAIKGLKEEKSEQDVLLLLQQRLGRRPSPPAARPRSTPPVMHHQKPPAVTRLWQPRQIPCRQKAPQRCSTFRQVINIQRKWIPRQGWP